MVGRTPTLLGVRSLKASYAMANRISSGPYRLLLTTETALGNVRWAHACLRGFRRRSRQRGIAELRWATILTTDLGTLDDTLGIACSQDDVTPENWVFRSFD